MTNLARENLGAMLALVFAILIGSAATASAANAAEYVSIEGQPVRICNDARGLIDEGQCISRRDARINGHLPTAKAARNPAPRQVQSAPALPLASAPVVRIPAPVAFPPPTHMVPTFNTVVTSAPSRQIPDHIAAVPTPAHAGVAHFNEPTPQECVGADGTYDALKCHDMGMLRNRAAGMHCNEPTSWSDTRNPEACHKALDTPSPRNGMLISINNDPNGYPGVTVTDCPEAPKYKCFYDIRGYRMTPFFKGGGNDITYTQADVLRLIKTPPTKEGIKQLARPEDPRRLQLASAADVRPYFHHPKEEIFVDRSNN